MIFLAALILVTLFGFDGPTNMISKTGVIVGNLFYFFFGIVVRENVDVNRFKNPKLSLLLIVYVLMRLVAGKITVDGVLGRVISATITLCRYTSFIIGIYSLAGLLSGKAREMATYVGRLSFSVYLLHMPVAGVTANLLNRSEAFAVVTFVRPIIVIIITLLGIELYRKITRNNQIALLLIGGRA